jgi:hypothetical protein
VFLREKGGADEGRGKGTDGRVLSLGREAMVAITCIENDLGQTRHGRRAQLQSRAHGRGYKNEGLCEGGSGRAGSCGRECVRKRGLCRQRTLLE